MESMWNLNIPWNLHGIHVEYVGSIKIPTWNPHGIHMEYIYSMDSIWNIFHHINKVFIHMDSTWNEHRIIPGGFHMNCFHLLYMYWDVKKNVLNYSNTIYCI